MGAINLACPDSSATAKPVVVTDQSLSLAGLQQPQHRRNHQSPSRAGRGGRLAAFELTCMSPLRRLQQVVDADEGAMTAPVGQTGAGEASLPTWVFLHFACRTSREHGTSSVGQSARGSERHARRPFCPAAPGPLANLHHRFPHFPATGKQGQVDGAAGRAGWIHSEGAAALLHPNAAPEALQQPLSWSVVAGDVEKEARRQDLTRSTWTIGLPRLEMPTSSARQPFTEALKVRLPASSPHHLDALLDSAREASGKRPAPGW